MFIFIKRAFILGGGLPTRPKIKIKAFELFFLTYLIGAFFS